MEKVFSPPLTSPVSDLKLIFPPLQDEKAEGFINVSSYNIEGAGEHKRK